MTLDESKSNFQNNNNNNNNNNYNYNNNNKITTTTDTKPGSLVESKFSHHCLKPCSSIDIESGTPPKYCMLKPSQRVNTFLLRPLFSFKDPVEVTGRRENAFVAGGDVKTLTRPVDGNPRPNIEWYIEKTGRKLSSGKQYKTGKSGCYTCVAWSSLGTPVNITQCLTVGKFSLVHDILA